MLLIIICMSVHFRKETLLRFAIGVLFDHYFGRVRYLLEEVILYHFENTIILKNPVSFCSTL
jgi:hypothetical protein